MENLLKKYSPKAPNIVFINLKFFNVPKKATDRKILRNRLVNEVYDWIIKFLEQNVNNEIQYDIIKTDRTIIIKSQNKIIFRFSLFLGINGAFRKLEYKGLLNILSNKEV